MATMTYGGELTVTSCWCGIRYAAPAELEKAARANPRMAVYCPLGHQGFYTDDEAKRLKRELAEKERQLEAARATQRHLAAEAEHERRRANGMKGAMVKAKKRAARGVCPAPGCKRSFVDVARHVQTCHPDLDGGES